MNLPCQTSAVSLVMGLLFASHAHASDWYVDASATAPGNGTLAQPFARIDAALAASTTVSGDRIWVAPGDYVDESIDFLGKQVILQSSAGPATTVVRGLGVGTTPHALVQAISGEGSGAVLRGFTLRDAPGVSATVAAAVVLRGSSMRIENCRFENNLAGGAGSAVHIDGGAPRLVQCTFRDNGGDGAVYAVSSDLDVQNCTWESSAAPIWGGLVIDRGRLVMNQTQMNPNGSGAGHPEAAMHLLARQATVEITGCAFEGNAPGSAGGRGIYLNYCFATIEACQFENYHTQNQSGAAFLGFDGDVAFTNCLFQGCRVANGYGGAVALVGCRASFVQCQLIDNQASQRGGSIYKWGFENLFIVQSHLQQNQAEAGGAIFVALGPLFVQGSTFTHNAAVPTSNAQDSLGGAIATLDSLQVTQAWFADNVAGSSTTSTATGAKGGALYVALAADVSHTLFEDNRVVAEQSAVGGALASEGSGNLVRCIAKRNLAQASQPGAPGQGGAFWGPVRVTHGTLVHNAASQAGGAGYDVQLDHSIVFENQPDDLAGNATATYSLVPGGFVGTGNRDGDPRFWGPNDLHLLPGSIAIDAGNPNLPTDPDGTPLDLGAILFDAQHCGPGCTGEISVPVCTSQPNSSGQVGTLKALGNSSVGSNLVILLSDQLPLGLPGYYLIATDPGFVPFFGGSQGTLCLGGALYRLNQNVQRVNAAGEVSRTLDLTELPALGAQVLPGETWHFQFWHRDFIGVVSTSNTTQSAAITFQ